MTTTEAAGPPRPLPEKCPQRHDDPHGCGTCGWDGKHTTTTKTARLRGRASCTCGWVGQLRRGVRSQWEAAADGDQHVNER